jgi:anti-sigma regulatory factor (Ser/Thr protein kinase)
MSGSVAESAPPNVVVRTDILSRSDAALVAREVVARATSELGPAILDDLLLVVSELVTNAVRHAPDRGPIHLEIQRDHVVRIEVQDQGEGFERTARPPLHQEFPIGGFGLTVVGRLVTGWGITRRGARTLVWAELPLRDDAGVAHDDLSG